MVSVRINGSESAIQPNRLQKVTDLVELIKSSIDPEHIITQFLIDGRELTEQEWSGTLNQFETSIIEFETGTPETFVQERFASSADVVGTCYLEFRDARKSFQSGDMANGNQRLVQAVNTARAFFDWYGTLLQLLPEAKRGQYDINPQVREITEICKRICQQQLYQSWWALGETLEKELEPKLDKLEDFCRTFRRTM